MQDNEFNAPSEQESPAPTRVDFTIDLDEVAEAIYLAWAEGVYSGRPSSRPLAPYYTLSPHLKEGWKAAAKVGADYLLGRLMGSNILSLCGKEGG